MLDTGVMLVHMNMTRGQTYRIRDVFTPFRNGAERFFLAAVLFDVFLVIAGIPAIAGVKPVSPVSPVPCLLPEASSV